MMFTRAVFSVLILCGIAGAQTARHQVDVFPGKTWITATPEDLGWSKTNLDEAWKFFDALPPASLFVVDHGRVVVDQKSRYPAYQFRMTARDLARLGLLMLRNGNWNGSQVIPAGWVEESTHAYTTDTHPLQTSSTLSGSNRLH